MLGHPPGTVPSLGTTFLSAQGLCCLPGAWLIPAALPLFPFSWEGPGLAGSAAGAVMTFL